MLGDQFTQLATQCYQLNESTTTTNIPIPQLSTFEKLLSTIDNETNQGHQQTRADVAIKNNSNYDFGFNFDIKSLQQHVERINNRIETQTSEDERKRLYKALFESLSSTFETRCYGNNSYLTYNWIVEALKTNFWGIKHYHEMKNNLNGYKMDSIKFGLSKNIQMNLECVKYVLQHEKELQTVINLIVPRMGYDLESYFYRYEHKCDTSDYFTSGVNDDNDNDNEDDEKLNVPISYEDLSVYPQYDLDVIFKNKNRKSNENDKKCDSKTVYLEVLDMLRNVLFVLATVHYISTQLSSCYTIEEKNKSKFFKGLQLLTQRYLDLELLDGSIDINGISLYHLFVNQFEHYPSLLKMLLESKQCDWSIFKDNYNRVSFFCFVF